jgi:hypothetical protein
MMTADILNLSPARLGHANDVTGQGFIPEADTAELKLAKVSARTPAHLASITVSGGELLFPRRLHPV